jgi:eukaryotic-like serine/threonine-protein kinase
VTAAEKIEGIGAGRPSSALAVPLGTKHQILPDHPLPTFNVDGALAYRAIGLRDGTREYFALVCDPAVPARFDVALQLIETDPSGLMEILNAGPVDWPPARGRRLAMVYAVPGGPRVVRNLKVPREPIAEEMVVRALMRPAVTSLRNLATRGIVHGAVRPDNMFFADTTGGSILLGDCVTAPSGFRQPAMFEPIERAQAERAGRGPGSWADDLFALGVSLLWLSVGQNPVPDLDEAELMAQRIDRGTYATYIVDARLPTGLHEILRALLADDPRQRPTLKEMEQWVATRRITMKQMPPPRRAARPIEFDGNVYAAPRLLAHAMAGNPALASLLVESGDVERWLRRSVLDDSRADVVHAAFVSASAAGGSSSSVPDRIIARAIAAVDPSGPIRYKGRAVMPQGIGTALQSAMASGEDPQPIVEVITGGLVGFWVGAQLESRQDLNGLVQIFDQLRVIVDRGVVGYGTERVMYELCPQAPCLSPILGGSHAGSPFELLALLNEIGTSPGRALEPMDRHVAGFLMARHRKIDDRYFTVLGPGSTPAKRALGILAILADTQRQFGPENLRGLCQWMLPSMRPAIDRFRGVENRKRLAADLSAVAEGGDLMKMLAVIDDPKVLRDDGRAFDAARMRYTEINDEIATLQASVNKPDLVARTDGRQTTAVISAVASAVLVFAVVARAFAAR